jgi:hypothetical protein
VDSVLRLKRSEYLCEQTQTIQLRELLHYFPRGATRSYRQITVTKASTFLLNMTITWGDAYEEPLMLITTLEEATPSVTRYQQRFWIEPMFKDQKSNGFDLEATRVTDAKRIESLLILSVLAHLFCSCEGVRQETQGTLKKTRGVTRIRPVGLFLVGLKAFKQRLRRATRRQFLLFLRGLFAFMMYSLRI